MLKLWLVFVLGLVVGSIVVNIIWNLNQSSGVLKIDQSNSEKDIYRIELDSLDNLSKKKRVSLKVDAKANPSQE